MAEPFKAYRTASGKSVLEMLTEFGTKAETSLGAALYQEAQGIMAASQGLVPVDTGALRSSSYVTEPERDVDRITVILGYGGVAAKINPKSGQSTDGYAIIVHENLEAFHKVGTAKFLELPFNAARRGMSARIVAKMKADMAGAASAEAGSLGEPEV
jgi:hypothetical protein